MNDDMDDVIKEFLIECNEGLDQLDRDLVELEKNPDSAPLLASVFRSVHTIKGTGGVLGFSKLTSVAHVGENLLSRMRDGKLRLNAEITTVLLAVIDACRNMLACIADTGSDGDGDYSKVIAAVSAILETAAPTKVEPAPAPVAAAPPAKAPEPAPAKAPAAAPAQASAPPAAPAPPPVPKLGEFLVSKGAVEPAALKEALAQQASGDPGKLGEILVEHKAVEPAAIREALQSQEEALQAQVEKRDALASSTIRVDVGLLDKVMNLVGELVLARNQVLQFTTTTQDTAFLGHRPAAQPDHHRVAGRAS